MTRRRRSLLWLTNGVAWYAPLPGSNPGFLVQQNSIRDAVLAALNLNIFARHADRVRGANIAQMINVLQAMIMTDKEKMVMTPTYHVFKMYVPFQDATFIPVTFNAGTYTHGDLTLPRVDAIAAKDSSGKLWLALTNVDPNNPVEIEVSLTGINANSATGQTLTAPKVDSVNTFDAPNAVNPKTNLSESPRRQVDHQTRSEVSNGRVDIVELIRCSKVLACSKGRPRTGALRQKSFRNRSWDPASISEEALLSERARPRSPPRTHILRTGVITQ